MKFYKVSSLNCNYLYCYSLRFHHLRRRRSKTTDEIFSKTVWKLYLLLHCTKRVFNQLFLSSYHVIEFLYFLCINSIFFVFTFDGHNCNYSTDHDAFIVPMKFRNTKSFQLIILVYWQSIIMQFLILLFFIEWKFCAHLSNFFLLFHQKSTKTDKESKRGNIVAHAIIIVYVFFCYIFFFELISLKPIEPAIMSLYNVYFSKLQKI